jgi:GT2 family glycosyltransferase
VVNPDVGLPPGFADRLLGLIGYLDAAQPRAGVVGFRLRHGDGSEQLSCGRWPTLPRTLLGLLRPRARRKYVATPARRREVEWVTGCCWLLRRDCLCAVGGLDPSFFLYYEDVDLCRRARAAGWTVWFDPGLTAVHHRPLHTRPLTPLFRLVARHGLLTYARKHWPAWQARALSWIVRLEAWFRGRRARRQEDLCAADLAAELGELAAARTPAAAMRILRRAVRQHAADLRPRPEDRLGSVHHHPQPRPGVPSGPLPAQPSAAWPG